MKYVRLNTSLLWTVCGCTLDFAIQMHLLWIDIPTLNLELFLTLFSKFPCVLYPKIEWNLVPKIVHLRSALRHNMWRDGTMRTTNTSNSPCVHALIEQWPKKEISCEDLGTKGQRIARLVQWHGYESCGEIKDCDISWVFAKEAIKYDFLNVPLRLNTCLHWTIRPTPKGVQCKQVSLYIKSPLLHVGLSKVR